MENKTKSLSLIQENDREDFLYYGSLGDTNKINDLLDKGVDPNICDDNGTTIMHYAAQHGYIDIVDALLEHRGFTTTHLADDYQSPFLLAIKANQNEVVKHILLKCAIDVSDALCIAAKQGSLPLVQTLLESKKVDANTLNNEGHHPLIKATEKGHVPVMQLLIDNGATVNYCSHNNETPLYVATYYGHTSATRLLIEHDADANIPESTYSRTPLHISASLGHAHIVKLLLRSGACVNAQDTHKRMAIDYTKKNDIKQLLMNHQNYQESNYTSEANENNCITQ